MTEITKKSYNKYDRVMPRVYDRSRSSLKFDSLVTRHDTSSAVHLGGKPSVSNVGSAMFSDLPTVLNDYKTESPLEKPVKRTFVVKPRRTLKSLDPALSPPRSIRRSQELGQKPHSMRVRGSAPSVLSHQVEKWPEAHMMQCCSSRSHSKLKELKNEIKEYQERDKLMRLRSQLYKNCGVVLDDLGQPAADKAVQVEEEGTGQEQTIQRNHGISPLHQLLLTLRFYALGTMLVAVADYVGVSKSSAGRILKDVSQAIAKLYPKYVYIHNDTQEDFYNIARFPRVLGAVDGTHILMQSPNSNIGEEFRNRKSVFSLNVQGVCDAQLRFMNVVARWPGSTHDATIFNNSELRAECEAGRYGNRWLLGDSAYPCKSYLLTPLLNTQTSGDINYNRAHIKTRNTIERCFGVWKRRFPVISLKIRLAMDTTQAVIIATAVLHNICRQTNLEDVEPEIDIPNHNITFRTEDIPESHSGNQFQERQLLINNYFR